MNRLLVAYGLALIIYLIAVASFGGTLSADKGAFGNVTVNGSNVLTLAGGAAGWSGHVATQTVDMAGFGMNGIGENKMSFLKDFVFEDTFSGIIYGTGSRDYYGITNIGWQVSVISNTLYPDGDVPRRGWWFYTDCQSDIYTDSVFIGENSGGLSSIGIGGYPRFDDANDRFGVQGNARISGRVSMSDLTVTNGSPTAGAVLTATNASGDVGLKTYSKITLVPRGTYLATTSFTNLYLNTAATASNGNITATATGATIRETGYYGVSAYANLNVVSDAAAAAQLVLRVNGVGVSSPEYVNRQAANTDIPLIIPGIVLYLTNGSLIDFQMYLTAGTATNSPGVGKGGLSVWELP